MIKLIYWSGTGNTEKMASSIRDGILENNKEVEVEVKEVSIATAEDITSSEVVVLGCPAMGSEELDDTEMLPFIEDNKDLWSGKKVILFGSYGWGSGEWMEAWVEQMKGYGASVANEPLIVNEFTEGQDEVVCKAYGKQI